MGEILLDWEDHDKALSNKLWEFFKEEYLVDFSVTCHGNNMKVHKFAMAFLFPMLKESLWSTDPLILDNGQPTRDDKVATEMRATPQCLSLDNIAEHAEDLDYLVQFAYTGKATVPEEHADCLMHIADSMEIESLKECLGQSYGKRKLNDRDTPPSRLRPRTQLKKVISDSEDISQGYRDKTGALLVLVSGSTMSSTANEGVQIPVKPRKRQETGRISDVGKKLKLSSHEMGDACHCMRLKCFDVTTEDERAAILRNFNKLKSHDEQNNYLAGLITILPVNQRRPRQAEELALLREAAFAYRVRVCDGNQNKRDIPVCAKAFRAVHGITKSKLEYLQKGLKLTGSAPKDNRGKHSSKHRKLNETIKSLICKHIKSFKGRQSHYSSKDSRKTYLPEGLTVKKMFSMFKEQNPTVVVSYETYRSIFNTQFNISFGYPRTDTYANCDEFTSKGSQVIQV